MASEYQHIDTIRDVDGNPVAIGVREGVVIIGISRTAANEVHLDATQREQFQRAFMAAERAAETYDRAHPW